MDKFHWAYIGCGSIAEITAKEILRSGQHEITAVWNRTRERAEKFAGRYGGQVFDTVDEAVCAPETEGVYIATTPDKHPEYIRRCIVHRRPVLCEKPFAVSAAMAKALLDEAAQAGVYVSEAMWTWHNDIALRVKEWVRSGRVGEIREVRMTYGYPLICFSPKHRLRDPVRIGGALLDIGIYPVRYCYELFGMPEEIKCRGVLKGGVDLREEVELRYGGFTARLNIAMDRMLGERAVIAGSKGVIRIPQPHASRRARAGGSFPETVRDGSDLYARQFSNVAEEIRAGSKNGVKVPAEGTVDVMRILDECRRQMGLVYPCER